MMQRVGVYIIFIVLTGCKTSNKTDADYFIQKFEEGTDSTNRRQYDEESRLISTSANYFGSVYETSISYNMKSAKTIQGHFLKSLYGHYFDFYENGNLKMYCYYFGEDKKSSYIRDYSEEGRIVNIQGNVFVDHMISDGDSVDLFFSGAFADSIYAYSSFSNFPETSIQLEKSSMQPMLWEGRVRLMDSVLRLRVYYIDKNEKNGQSIYDTLIIR